MVTKNFEKISDEKKEQIITKGIEIFSKFSFVEARTDLITHEAGLKVYYFIILAIKRIFTYTCLNIQSTY